MTPQKITVKIPRRQGEMIPFNLELWNTGEYDVIDNDKGIGRVLCTDNGGDYPVVVGYGNSDARTYTIYGKFRITDRSSSLFLRKKSSDVLPKDDFINVYSDGIGSHSTLVAANNNALKSRLAIIHITYQWDDAQ